MRQCEFDSTLIGDESMTVVTDDHMVRLHMIDD